MMDLQLNGKKALVSGSTAGIGLAIATTLAGEGAAVIIAGRRHEKLQTLENLFNHLQATRLTLSRSRLIWPLLRVSRP